LDGFLLLQKAAGCDLEEEEEEEEGEGVQSLGQRLEIYSN
jgi:hypothetical protein